MLRGKFSAVMSVVSLHKMTNPPHLKLTLVHNLFVVRSLRNGFKRIKCPEQEHLEVFNYDDKYNMSKEELNDADYEPDIMNIKLNRQDFEREMDKAQHYIRVKLLQKKYFKQKREPSLLTWEEREQIRNLHKINPEKWNVHTLAESFPATESVIKKILETDWKADIHRINLYNKRVAENWKKLYEGKLDISDETRNHLVKFSSRKKGFFSPPADSSIVHEESTAIVPVSTEFSDLVKQHKPQERISDSLQNTRQYFLQNSSSNAPCEETYVIDNDPKKRSQSLTTLNMYREKVLRSNKALDPIDKAMVDSYKTSLMKQEDLKQTITSSDFCIPKYDKTMVKLKSDQYGKNVIRDYINIPSNLKRKGSLYKLEDCYYDEDGKFLYRVPGMC